MPTCETCGSDYDKAFRVTMNGQTHTLDTSSVRSTPWRPPASTVARGSSDMGSKKTARSIVAITARARTASLAYVIGSEQKNCKLRVVNVVRMPVRAR